MKLSKVIKKYGDFEITDEMVKTIEPKLKLEVGKTYYAVELGGTVVHLTWEGNERDLFRLNKRNVYRTKEEAKFALDMYKFCKERSFTPDWTDENEYRYILVLDYDEREANWCRGTSFCQFPPFYYLTCDAVKEVIRRYTFDELAAYYGRV